MVDGNAADQALAYARAQIGKPYVFGATGPDSFDCSGLVYSAYKAVGISLGRTTYQQIFNGSPVNQTDLRIGDLVFPDAGHVQIFSGGGHVVEAPHTGANVREVAMWGFWRGRRIVDGGGTGALASTATTVGLSIPSPLGPVEQLGKAIGDGAAFFKLLTQASTYERLGLIVAGGFMVLAGLTLMSAGRIGDVAGVAGVAKQIRKVSK